MDKNISKNLGVLFFDLGVFLLLSIPLLSGLFLLTAALISFYKYKENYYKSTWNKYFFSSGIFLIISSIFLTFTNELELLSTKEPLLNWIGLLNWIPFFFCFWAIKPYLNNIKRRRKICLLVITGSIPLILTGLGQYFFNWHGPIVLFSGLLTWFQRPIHDTGGLTGLFNNENYAGLWLLIVWPMGLACLKDKYLSKRNKIIFLIISILIFVSALLTRSRMARVELIINYAFTFFNNGPILFIPLIFIFIVILFLKFVPFLINQFNSNSALYISTFNIFRNKDLILNISSLTRIEIWEIAIKSIFKRPLFGWGATSFPLIYNSERNDIFIAHTHNIFLEISLNHGLIVAVLLSIPIVSILFSSFRYIFIRIKDIEKINFDRAWWLSFFTILISQMIDIQYYDFRISMIFWILLSGLANSLEEYKKVY